MEVPSWELIAINIYDYVPGKLCPKVPIRFRDECHFKLDCDNKGK
jgi:hypothetical protein